MSESAAKLIAKRAFTPNHKRSKSAKCSIRRLVLDEVPSARVLDVFAGSGNMYRAVWRFAPCGYAGCDFRWFMDDRDAFVVDNRRLLRSIDLSPFNLFDLDAFGSPWEQALIIAARRRVTPGEVIGICLTDGSARNMKLGGLPLALREACGLSKVVAGALRNQDVLLEMAIAGIANRMGSSVTHQWQAKGTTGAMVRYLGLVLRGCGQ